MIGMFSSAMKPHHFIPIELRMSHCIHHDKKYVKKKEIERHLPV
jgi:hypothetical protein